MISILYTDTDQIRGCLLLSPEDLPDALFSRTLLERELQLDLNGWLPGHDTLINSGTSTQIDYLVSYATYWCAWHTAKTLAVSLPSKISDGKNSREIGTDYSALVEAMAVRVSWYRSALQATSTSASRAAAQFTVVNPGYDPVTGA